MQRGSIRQNGNHWLLKYRVKVIKDGKQKLVDQYHKLAPVDRQHQTEESVRPLADVFLAPFNTGTARPQSADLLITYLENFLTQAVGGRGNKISNSTVRTYRTSLKLARPFMDGLELRKVRTPEINQIFYKVAAANKQTEEDSKTGLANTTYRNLKNFLSSAFRKAVGDGLIEHNPVRDAITVKGNPADTYAYSLKEIKAIMNALDKTAKNLGDAAAAKNAVIAKNAVMLLSFTGLRKEEVKGLRWEDYKEFRLEDFNGKVVSDNFKGKVLDIKRAIVEGETLQVKTQYSKAPVPVINTVKETLATHLRVNTGDGFVFHGDTGEPMRLENLATRDIIPTLEKAGIEWHGFHAFRRGLATTLNDMGIAYETITHIMRHAPEHVTGRSYVKPSLKRMRKALEQVERKYKSQR